MRWIWLACFFGATACGSLPSRPAHTFEAAPEPLAFETAPLQADAALSLDVRLRDPRGADTTLRDLVRRHSLLVYLESDLSSRELREVALWLRRVAYRGRALGFRIVALFAPGTSPEHLLEWLTDRKLGRGLVAAIDHRGEFARASGWSPRSAALVDEAGRVAERLAAADPVGGRLGFTPGLTADLLFAAWAARPAEPELDAVSRVAVRELVERVAERPWAGDSLPDSVRARAEHPSLRRQTAGAVFVSVFTPASSERIRARHPPAPLGLALARAANAALRQASSAVADGRRIVLDLAGPATPLPAREPKHLWFLVEPGVDGLVVRRGGRSGVVLPGEVVSQGLLTPRVRGRTPKLVRLLSEASRRAGASPEAWRGEDAELLRFRSRAYLVREDRLQPLHRGKSLAPPGLEASRVIESLVAGAGWLADRVGSDGRFEYEYFPNRDRTTEHYSIVRHAVSVYALLEMYALAGREAALADYRAGYLEAAARGMRFLFDALEPAPGDPSGSRLCPIEAGVCESGNAATMLLALLARPAPGDAPEALRGDLYAPNDDQVLVGLGTTLLDMIDPDGRVFRDYRDAVENERVEREPPYYPGEAMLALLRLYERQREVRWLLGAKRIGDRRVWDRTRKPHAWPDHWVMQAFLPLWRIVGDDRYAATAFEMADHSVAEQYPNVWTPFADYLGAWRRKNDLPRTTRAASRGEALRGVVHLAWAKGADARRWGDALVAGARHLIEQQFDADDAYWMPSPSHALGAYPMGLVDNHCRIDNNQHALVGMIGALEVLRRRDAQTAMEGESTLSTKSPMSWVKSSGRSR